MKSKNSNTAERERAAKFHERMKERARQFPNESYDTRFNAVMSSGEGQQLFAQMKHADSGDFANSFPIASPRHKALVGLPATATQSEFEKKWRTKFGEPTAKSTSSSYTPQKPEKPDFERDAARLKAIQDARKERSESAAIFNAELSRLQSENRSYQDSWAIASTTEPGKTALQRWHEAAELIKHLGG